MAAIKKTAYKVTTMAKARMRSTTKMISFASMSVLLLIYRICFKIPKGTQYASKLLRNVSRKKGYF
jgi:hypothetical protein